MLKSTTLALAAITSAAAISSPADAGCRSRHYPRVHYKTRHVEVETQIVPVTKTAVIERTVVVKAEFLPKIHAGATIEIHGRFFGVDPGYVAMMVGKIDLKGQILAWSPTKVTAQIPDVDVSRPARLLLLVFNANGSVKKEIEVNLVNQLPDVNEIRVVEAAEHSTPPAPLTESPVNASAHIVPTL